MLSRSALLHSRGSLPGPPAGEGCFSERIRVGCLGKETWKGFAFGVAGCVDIGEMIGDEGEGNWFGGLVLGPQYNSSMQLN